MKEFADFEAAHKIILPDWYKDFILANGVSRLNLGPVIKSM